MLKYSTLSHIISERTARAGGRGAASERTTVPIITNDLHMFSWPEAERKH